MPCDKNKRSSIVDPQKKREHIPFKLDTESKFVSLNLGMNK